MAAIPGSYTRDEFRRSLDYLIRKTLEKPELFVEEKPTAILLGGQSGAGKTTLHRVFAERMRDNVAVINGDEYRALHPAYRELDAQFGPECVKYTAPWAGAMTESLIDALSLMGYNLVIEGTLRTYDVPLKTAQLLRGRGYGVSLAVMAVRPEISLLSCQIRYEQMRITGTVPRATDPAHHQAIVQEIASNLAHLEGCGLFSSVELYERSGRCLYDGKQERETASDVLGEKLFGPWSQEDRRHFDYLKRKYESLKIQG